MATIVGQNYAAIIDFLVTYLASFCRFRSKDSIFLGTSVQMGECESFVKNVLIVIVKTVLIHKSCR